MQNGYDADTTHFTKLVLSYADRIERIAYQAAQKDRSRRKLE
jgi:hypothetical protein